MNKTTDARKKAMALLEIRDRTEKELSDRLLRCGFTQEETEEAMDYVRSFGYINDRRYAENYIAFYKDGKSRQKILMALVQKGIDSSLAREVWEECAGEDHSELPQILREIRRKAEPGRAVSPKKMRSLTGSLARKGYSYDDIRDALEQEGITVDYSLE